MTSGWRRLIIVWIGSKRTTKILPASSASASVCPFLDGFSMNRFWIGSRCCKWNRTIAPSIHSTTLRATKLSCFFRRHLTSSSVPSFRSHSKKSSKHNTSNFNQRIYWKLCSKVNRQSVDNCTYIYTLYINFINKYYLTFFFITFCPSS